MRIFSKSQIVFLLVLIILLLSLPLAVYLVTRRQHDIRPRATFAGAADLLLHSSNKTPLPGEVFTVVVSTHLTNKNLRVSGADFKVLYDKNFLTALRVMPEAGGGKPFTDVLINKKEKRWNKKYNFFHVSEIAKKEDHKLPGGVIKLARVRFRAKKKGDAKILFPKNDHLQIVGIDLGAPTTEMPPTSTPKSHCPSGSSCISNQQCWPASRIVPGGNCPEGQICCSEITPTPTST